MWRVRRCWLHFFKKKNYSSIFYLRLPLTPSSMLLLALRLSSHGTSRAWQTTFVNWNPACIWAQPIKFHHVKLLLFLGSMKWTTWLISIIKWMDGARERVSRWWMPYGLQTSEEHMSNYGTWVINEHVSNYGTWVIKEHYDKVSMLFIC